MHTGIFVCNCDNCNRGAAFLSDNEKGLTMTALELVKENSRLKVELALKEAIISSLRETIQIFTEEFLEPNEVAQVELNLFEKWGCRQ